MPKRKSSAALAQPSPLPEVPLQAPVIENGPPPQKRRASARNVSQTKASTNPDKNANVLDAPEAFRASPDADTKDERMDLGALMDVDNEVKDKDKDDSVPSLVTNGDSDSPLSDISEMESPIRPKAPPVKAAKKGGKAKSAPTRPDTEPAALAKDKKEASKEPQFLDPEADGEEEADEEEIKEALSRPPPVNSDYLPLPWGGRRLGYACLNTYLRFSTPPVFSSRTCRIASILENRHPLRDPNEPPHATKNRPDREQPASTRRGQDFVEQLCLANVRDISKMLRWNDRYGIKFMRLSSEMFPFASHEEYGYKLAPFASEALAEAGKVAAELGHRLTTHPGQFTQLGSPRKPVIDNALRDLDYHAELLSLLKLPPQQDRDAVMILHLGGVFGDKAATLDRFRHNYVALPQAVKDRLVLENDDVSWSVHELLPLCEDLNIPLVLDYHHHNIIFDAAQIREGTRDIMDLYPRILATWKRKNITPKMHYSEPCPDAITGRQRRKHSPRVITLPPVPEGVDLMIEAKDKEQAVFELMRTFKLPGHHLFNDIIPHVRKDENRPVKTPKKPKTPKKKPAAAKMEDDDDEEGNEVEAPPDVPTPVAEDETGMGGPDGRVYWPPGQEHWLRPVKRVVAPRSKAPPGKELDEKGRIITPAMKRKRAAAAAAEEESKAEAGAEADADGGAEADVGAEEGASAAAKTGQDAPPRSKPARGKGKAAKEAEAEGERLAKEVEAEVDAAAAAGTKGKGKAKAKGRGKVKMEEEEKAVDDVPEAKRRRSRGNKVDYKEGGDGEEE
ncbi:MAG: hypothetical protein LQ344_000745 [Seirophora lacunosa]|nr:MAG: hypothetical protein LQ344_000745 [Seirophora lacunosa]